MPVCRARSTASLLTHGSINIPGREHASFLPVYRACSTTSLLTDRSICQVCTYLVDNMPESCQYIVHVRTTSLLTYGSIHLVGILPLYASISFIFNYSTSIYPVDMHIQLCLEIQVSLFESLNECPNVPYINGQIGTPYRITRVIK